MKLLLDTHILIWAVAEPRRLKSAILDALPEAQLWVSPISAWECLLAAEKGRLDLGPDPARWFRDAIQLVAAREAPLTHAVALMSRKINVAHQDPADRFLAATAVVYDLTLATEDDRLIAGTGYAVLANR